MNNPIDIKIETICNLLKNLNHLETDLFWNSLKELKSIGLSQVNTFSVTVLCDSNDDQINCYYIMPLG